jgi:hypothetical protein
MNTDIETMTSINPSIEMAPESIFNSPITEDDKERFFKSMLSDDPYEETFELFGGQLRLTFKAMTVQENSDVVSQIILDRKHGVAADNDAYLITVTAYRLSLCLKAINDQVYSTITKTEYAPTEEKNSYVFARTEPMLSWATPKLSSYIDAFRAFEHKLIKLTAEVQNKNFWKASA